MNRKYNESFKDLYHGTIESRAAQIVRTQTFIPSKRGWCGSGVYFYDNKSKAWWSAQRTSVDERKKGNLGDKPDIVIADIKSISRTAILDLRAPDDLKSFADYVNKFLSDQDFDIVDGLEDKNDSDEEIILKREILLSFYCEENGIQLIIGYFKQREQEKIDIEKCFADTWQLVIGIETIYCAKDPGIVHNIRRRGEIYG